MPPKSDLRKIMRKAAADLEREADRLADQADENAAKSRDAVERGEDREAFILMKMSVKTKKQSQQNRIRALDYREQESTMRQAEIDSRINASMKAALPALKKTLANKVGNEEDYQVTMAALRAEYQKQSDSYMSGVDAEIDDEVASLLAPLYESRAIDLEAQMPTPIKSFIEKRDKEKNDQILSALPAVPKAADAAF